MTVLHIYEKIIMNVSFQGADMSLTHSTMYIVTSRDFMHNECKWPSPVFGLSVQCVCVCVCARVCVFGGRGCFLVSLWQSFSQSVVYRGPEGLNEENCSYICLIVLGLFVLILTDRRWDYFGLTMITILPLLVCCLLLNLVCLDVTV